MRSWDRDRVSIREGKGVLQVHMADGHHDETLTPLTARDGKFHMYSLQHLPHNHEDPSSVPSDLIKSQVWWCVPVAPRTP